MDTEYIWGKNPVKELLRWNKRKVAKLYLQDTRYKEYKKELPILNIPVIRVNRNKLFDIVKRRDHQGIVAETSPFPYTDFETIRARSPKLILVSEGVTDPQNLGAMIRSAFLLGVGGMIIETKFSASITPVVTHTSAGATEGLAIAMVDSIAHALQELKRINYTILATEIPGEGSIDIRDIDTDRNIAFILGSEGHGVKIGTKKIADQLISIPQAESLDSFSVSAATAIISFVLASQKKIV